MCCAVVSSIAQYSTTRCKNERDMSQPENCKLSWTCHKASEYIEIDSPAFRLQSSHLPQTRSSDWSASHTIENVLWIASKFLCPDAAETTEYSVVIFVSVRDASCVVSSFEDATDSDICAPSRVATPIIPQSYADQPTENVSPPRNWCREVVSCKSCSPASQENRDYRQYIN